MSQSSTNHLSHLLILASSNLPIGSYTYSQGVESAIDTGLINDEVSAFAYLQDYQQDVLLGNDLPLLTSLMLLLQSDDLQLTQFADELAQFYQASRDSHEFALESQQLAQAFTAWIEAVLALDMPDTWVAQGYLPLFARLCHFWQLPCQQALQTYAFAQIENLTLAVVKTLPLGQMAGQRIIWQLQTNLAPQLPKLYKTITKKIGLFSNEILTPTSQDIRNLKSFAFSQNLSYQIQKTQKFSQLIQLLNLSTTQPNLSHLSCLHEQQYSRLFRS